MFEGLGQSYLASRRTHEIRWQFIDLVVGSGMVVVLWLLIGRAVGIASAIIWAVLMIGGLFVLFARRRHERTGD
jgi:hypothetical protein